MKSETTGFSTILDAPGNVSATKKLSDILGPKVFSFPKPSEMVRILVEQTTNPGDLILDSFAGSGTTGHAVLALNKADGGNRRFILVEMDPKIATEVTAQRLSRVIKGYGETPGLGGGFRFCTLGPTVFDERGKIRDEVSFRDLAHHIFFSETGEPLPKSVNGQSPLIGVLNDTAYYLLYSGNSGEMLSTVTLRKLPKHAGKKVIYGDSCRMSRSQLKNLGVMFKQIPYEIKVT